MSKTSGLLRRISAEQGRAPPRDPSNRYHQRRWRYGWVDDNGEVKGRESYLNPTIRDNLRLRRGQPVRYTDHQTENKIVLLEINWERVWQEYEQGKTLTGQIQEYNPETHIGTIYNRKMSVAFHDSHFNGGLELLTEGTSVSYQISKAASEGIEAINIQLRTHR